jgi:glycosyltransferase involved in cell wall biosynthesis
VKNDKNEKPPRVLFVVNVAWFFLSHRLNLARGARERGFEVHVATGRGGGEADIISEGFGFHSLPLSRPGMGLVGETHSFLAMWRLLKQVKPDIVHLVTIKPVIYGGIAARFAKIPAVVSAISGLGYVFLVKGRRAAVRRGIVRYAYKLALNQRHGRVIFQNRDDEAQLASAVPEGQSVMIPGSGVDIGRFLVRPEPSGPPLIVLASRLLWDKGIGEYVDAARLAKAKGVKARFVLVGETDSENRSGIPDHVIESWKRENVVEIWGRRNDMPEVFANSTIAALPSYREGLPKVLIEAAACGRPLVATNVPGCREIVRHGENGLLVPAKDPAALEHALEILVGDPALRCKMGARGREMVEQEFADEHVVSATLNIYEELLSETGFE